MIGHPRCRREGVIRGHKVGPRGGPTHAIIRAALVPRKGFRPEDRCNPGSPCERFRLRPMSRSPPLYLRQHRLRNRLANIEKTLPGILLQAARAAPGTVRVLNCSGRKETESSSQVRGVATVAPGRARVEYDAIAVAPFSFLR